MASTSSSCSYFFLITITQFLLICAAHKKIKYVYQFGDSLSDTGNLIRVSPAGAATAASRPPYGQTFFGKPTGRWSDGRLVIDFVAKALKIPLLNPYLEKNASFEHGANFAVSGSTALDSSVLAARGIQPPIYNTPLNAQLKWFRDHLNSTCHSPAGRVKRLRKALVFMGEIGGNDFNYALSQGKSIELMKTVVPDIVGTITHGVREVIRLGAIRVIVPGIPNLGCLPIFMTTFHSNDSGAYDDLGCMRFLDEFLVFHNTYLQGALLSLKQEFPHATIVYFDFYSAFQSIIRNASSLGFDKTPLKACCGTGGSYNFDPKRPCGSPGVPVCPNPTQRIPWDARHLTQAAYYHISKILIADVLSKF